MVVATLELGLRLDGCFNLKDKRRVLRSLLDRLHRDYHVAAAEVEDTELWNSATIGVALVSNNAIHAESYLQKVLDVVDQHPEIVVEDLRRDIERR